MTSRRAAAVERVRSAGRTQFLRDIYGTVGVSMVVVITGGLQAVLIARRFGPAGKGLIALVLLIPGTLSPLLGAGFAASCVFFASRAPASRVMENATVYALAATAVGVVLTAVLAVTGALDQIAPDLPHRYLFIALAMLPVALGQSLFGGLLMGLGHIARVNSIRAYQAFLSLVIVGLAVLLDRGAVVITSGLVLAAAGALWLQLRALAVLGAPLRARWHSATGREQAAFAARDHPGTVVQFMNYRLDQLFVSGYQGASNLGLYSVAVTLGELLWLVPDSIATVVFPQASRERLGEGRRATTLVALSSLALAGAGAVGLLLVGQPLIALLFSHRFDASFAALRWLLPGAVVLGPAKILTADLAGRGYPTINSACSVVGLFATVGFDIALIPSHGIKGAAMASSISYATVAVLALVAFIVLRTHAEPRDDYASTSA